MRKVTAVVGLLLAGQLAHAQWIVTPVPVAPAPVRYYVPASPEPAQRIERYYFTDAKPVEFTPPPATSSDQARPAARRIVREYYYFDAAQPSEQSAPLRAKRKPLTVPAAEEVFGSSKPDRPDATGGQNDQIPAPPADTVVPKAPAEPPPADSDTSKSDPPPNPTEGAAAKPKSP